MESDNKMLVRYSKALFAVVLTAALVIAVCPVIGGLSAVSCVCPFTGPSGVPLHSGDEESRPSGEYVAYGVVSAQRSGGAACSERRTPPAHPHLAGCSLNRSVASPCDVGPSGPATFLQTTVLRI